MTAGSTCESAELASLRTGLPRLAAVCDEYRLRGPARCAVNSEVSAIAMAADRAMVGGMPGHDSLPLQARSPTGVAGQDVQRAGGVAGPVLFTAAWVVSSLRQAGHPAVRVQLSGLAADDARDPQIMVAAFVVLGACLIGFGAALRPVAARPAGPWLVMAAGAAAVAAR